MDVIEFYFGFVLIEQLGFQSNLQGCVFLAQSMEPNLLYVIISTKMPN